MFKKMDNEIILNCFTLIIVLTAVIGTSKWCSNKTDKNLEALENKINQQNMYEQIALRSK